MAKHKRNKWNDQELHHLFAERLPLLEMPDGLLDRLTGSVLGEVGRYVEQHNIPCGHTEAGDDGGSRESLADGPLALDRTEQAPMVNSGLRSRCRVPKDRMPPM